MTKLKMLKNEMIEKRAWKQYKEMFKHKQMKFVFSKVMMVFNEEVSLDDLVLAEFEMLKSSKKDGIEMFVKAFENNAEKLSKHKADWKEFARFIFFAFQTSTFWKDDKKKIENIYTHENYIKMNEQKRKHFYNWLHSLDTNISEYNSKIINTMQKVF